MSEECKCPICGSADWITYQDTTDSFYCRACGETFENEGGSPSKEPL